MQKKISGWRARGGRQIANDNNKSDWRSLSIIRRLANSTPLRKLKSIFRKKSQSSLATTVEYQQIPSPPGAASDLPSSPHTSDSSDSLGSLRFEARMPEHLPTLASLSPSKSLSAARAPSLHSIIEETAEGVAAASKALIRSRLSMATEVSSVNSSDDMTENEENRRRIEEIEDEIFVLRKESRNFG